MIGDSITVGAQQPLEAMFTRLGFSPVTVNAQKSRRIDVGRGKYEPRAGTSVAEYVVGSTALPELWVIALGTNDAGLYRQADEFGMVIAHMLAIIPPTAPLAWIDIYRRDYLAGSQLLNVVLRDMLAKRGNAVVGDWYEQCTKADARILSGDGVHPNKRGFGVFTDTVRTAALSLVS
jgi:lysophospholipase L1-like esterase